MALVIRLGLVAALLGIAGASRANAPDESTLRAAMVYKLMLFVEWPAGALDRSDAVLLCVVSGDFGIGRAFAALSGRPIKGRTVQVERRGPLAGLERCNAVYFDRLDPGLLADKLSALVGRPVLTCAPATGPTAGPMIGLALDGQRLAFDVRQDALRAAGVGLDARVMQLAREVYR
jgi:hypothetical protein